MSATANLPALPSSLTPEGNLSRYLQEIRKFPLLELQQEFMLAKRLVAQRAMIDADRLADESVPLRSLMPSPT